MAGAPTIANVISCWCEGGAGWRDRDGAWVDGYWTDRKWPPTAGDGIDDARFMNCYRRMAKAGCEFAMLNIEAWPYNLGYHGEDATRITTRRLNYHLNLIHDVAPKMIVGMYESTLSQSSIDLDTANKRISWNYNAAGTVDFDAGIIDACDYASPQCYAWDSDPSVQHWADRANAAVKSARKFVRAGQPVLAVVSPEIHGGDKAGTPSKPHTLAILDAVKAAKADGVIVWGPWQDQYRYVFDRALELFGPGVLR